MSNTNMAFMDTVNTCKRDLFGFSLTTKAGYIRHLFVQSQQHRSGAFVDVVLVSLLLTLNILILILLLTLNK